VEHYFNHFKRVQKNRSTNVKAHGKRLDDANFLCGVNEIGGNKILLQDRDTRVFFDFGMSFTAKKSFIHHLSFRLKTRKAFKNSESCLRFREYTSLTKLLLKQTLCSFLMGIWIIRPICHSLNVKFPSTAVKQPKLSCEP